ncbi:MAG TPA: cytochrome c biogenesis protein ResB [Burkholderiaceae bacterium]|nr:cytochrome c biogenesis protein ResB [Burkholderiaceae bacterium]
MRTSPALQRWIAHFGSMRTALALMALLAAVALLRPEAASLALVIGVLGVNLLAALVVHPLLRRRLPLLVFHLSLLVLVLLVAAGRLARLDGRFELLQGEVFDGQLLDQAAGALYRPRLHGLAFRNDGFEIDYAAGRRRGATRNAVSWVDGAGVARRTVIGDHRPLVIEGHRFYTSPNKGFAPVLRWLPTGGAPLRGAVHLPSYPVHELQQSRVWTLPDGRDVWLQLQMDETPVAAETAARFRLPDEHVLVLRLGDARVELQPGQAWPVDGGTLVYEGLRTWMGYRVSHDPTLPWLLVASLLAALSLAWHYARAFAERKARAAGTTIATPPAEVTHA